MEDDPNFLGMVDELNLFENGRRPHFFFINGGRPQFFFKLETTSIFENEDSLIFF